MWSRSAPDRWRLLTIRVFCSSLSLYVSSNFFHIKMQVKIGLRKISDSFSQYHLTSIKAVKTVCKAFFLNCTLEESSTFHYDAENNGTGILNMIETGQLDTYEPLVSPTYKRLQLIDFSKPLLYMDVYIVTRAPSTSDSETVYNMSVSTSMGFGTWLSMIGAFILLSLLISCCKRFFLHGIDPIAKESSWLLACRRFLRLEFLELWWS